MPTAQVVFAPGEAESSASVPTCNHPQAMATQDRALSDAVSRGSLVDIRILLDGGVDIAGRDENGRTALHLATMNGSRPCIDFLLQRQASIDAPDANNCTPLHLASITGHQQCVSLLLSRQAQVNATDSILRPDSSGSTPLHLAAYNGHHPCVELLLQRQADINARDNDGETPLDSAAIAGQLRCVMLIDAGADTSVTNVRVMIRCPYFARSLMNKATRWIKGSTISLVRLSTSSRGTRQIK